MFNKKNEATPNLDENTLALFSVPKSVFQELLFPLFDKSLQKNILSINAQCCETINDNKVWQHFIDKYFPYLAKAKPKAYSTNAKRLFIKEFSTVNAINIPGLTKTQKIRLILASLCGDIELIEKSSIPFESKQILYVISAANGNELKHLDENGIIEAFKRAASIGNIDAAIWFLQHQQMTFKSIEQALENASLNGHLAIVKYLLMQQQAHIASDAKGQALRNAASKGHVKTAEFLINSCRNEISKGYLGRAFEDAAEKGYAKILAILNKPALDIDPTYKGRAFNLAAQFGNLAVIEYMLNHCLDSITYVEKGSALNYAAEIGDDNIVKTLLKLAGNDIDNVDKESALTLAASKGYLSVVQCILAEVGTEINADDKEQALQIAQNYGHGSIVEAFKQYNLGHAFKDAATFGQFEMVQWLLDRATDEIAPEFKGLALIGAAKNGYADVVEILLATSEIDEYHISRAIKFAQEQNYDAVISLLQAHKVKKAG